MSVVPTRHSWVSSEPSDPLISLLANTPVNSQIFGRFVAAAGIHGILFPSSKDPTKSCLALFVQNWHGSQSFIEIGC